MSEKSRLFTLEERLAYGRFSIKETCELAGKSRSSVNEDIKRKKLPIVKDGRRTQVLGPVLKRVYHIGGDTP